MPEPRPIIRILALSAYFLAAFLVFLFLLFPFDRIKSRLEAEVGRRTGLELAIAHVSPRFFNRFALRDVVVSTRSGSVLFESPEARATLPVIAFLRGMLALDLRASAYGGEIVLHTRQEKNVQSFQADANNLDIASYALLKQQGYHLAGMLGGNVEMTGDSGKGKIWVKGLASRELKVKGFPVPDLDFEQGWLEGELKGDRLFVKKLELEGKELKLRVSGDLVLREQGMLNLTVKLKPSERLARDQSALLSLLKNRDADGFYVLTLGGTIASPMPRL